MTARRTGLAVLTCAPALVAAGAGPAFADRYGAKAQDLLFRIPPPGADPVTTKLCVMGALLVGVAGGWALWSAFSERGVPWMGCSAMLTVGAVLIAGSWALDSGWLLEAMGPPDWRGR